LHSRRNRRESSSSLRSIAWLRFFCSTSSVLVLMQMPMVPGGWQLVQPRDGAAVGGGGGGGVGGGPRSGGRKQRAARATRWWWPPRDVAIEAEVEVDELAMGDGSSGPLSWWSGVNARGTQDGLCASLWTGCGRSESQTLRPRGQRAAMETGTARVDGDGRGRGRG
jgi:hypothetical protein